MFFFIFFLRQTIELLLIFAANRHQVNCHFVFFIAEYSSLLSPPRLASSVGMKVSFCTRLAIFLKEIIEEARFHTTVPGHTLRINTI
jgi:hypothetical protein